MNDAQKAAYWQHYARKHEDTVKAFNGLTPQQVKDLQAQNEAFEAEKMTADEKAVKAARDEAADAARQREAEYLPQIQKLQVQGIAASVIQGDKLNAFMSVVNPAALVDDKRRRGRNKGDGLPHRHVWRRRLHQPLALVGRTSVSSLHLRRRQSRVWWIR
jgi:hypothetical protein